ncbi:MAG TPA: SufD family Fe-S cluster assembly protein, partial [Cytophagaceae bacterium]
ATTGQIDQEALFYLQARGIGKENAKVLLMNAFASDIIEHIKIDALKENLLIQVSDKLSNINK